MKKLLAAIALVAFAIPTHAALTQSYLKKKLNRLQVTSVPGIVELYLSETGQRTRVKAAKVTVLLNGRPDDRASEFIGQADRVDVSSEGESVTVDVIISNLPKTKHDTVKNAVNNVR
jgi:hypothetical protein